MFCDLGLHPSLTTYILNYNLFKSGKFEGKIYSIGIFSSSISHRTTCDPLGIDGSCSIDDEKWVLIYLLIQDAVKLFNKIIILESSEIQTDSNERTRDVPKVSANIQTDQWITL